MSVKSVFKKIGKIALTAAPYVAAPFTGGASLAATGLANKAVQKWSEHDAKDAISKGLAPSNFDKVLGKVGNYASMASSFIPTGALANVGMLGKAAKAASVLDKANKAKGVASNALGAVKLGKTASTIGKALGTANAITNSRGVINPSPYGGNQWEGAMGMAGGLLNNRGNGGPEYGMDRNGIAGGGGGLGPSGRAVPRSSGGVMPRGGFNYRNNPMNQEDQNNPNLATSIFQGRQDAMKDQPFRGGYNVNYTQNGDDETQYTAQMPRIGNPSMGGSRRRRAS